MRPLSIYLWFGYNLPMEESLRLIKNAGFDGILLWWSSYEGAPLPVHQVTFARTLGLRVESAHFPDNNSDALWLPGMAGDSWLFRLTRALRECADSGVETLVVHLSDRAAASPHTPIGRDRLRRAAETARECRVRLAFENLPHPYHLEAVLDEFPVEYLGLCYDTGHARCAAAGFPEFPGRFASRLFTVHLHDNTGTDDQHLIPYDGTIDWTLETERLKAAGYGGPLCLEVQAALYEAHIGPEAFLGRAKRAVERLRDQLDAPANEPSE